MHKKWIWTLRISVAITCVLLAAYILLDNRNTDREPPVITVSDQMLCVSVSEPEENLLQGVTARDSRDGDVTDGLMIENIYGITEDGSATVIYAAFDREGNVSKTERTIQYTDYVRPRILLTGPLLFEYGSDFDVLDSMKATDLFEGDITRRIKATMLTSGASVGEAGMHQVQFRVTNRMGDTFSLILPVEVFQAGSYNGQLELTQYLIYLPVGAEFDPESYPACLYAGGQEWRLTGNGEEVALTISGDVDTDTSGVYPVTYTATAEQNGVRYSGRSRLIVVVEE